MKSDKFFIGHQPTSTLHLCLGLQSVVNKKNLTLDTNTVEVDDPKYLLLILKWGQDHA